MFRSLVSSSFAIFTYWETYVVILEYLLISLIPAALFRSRPGLQLGHLLLLLSLVQALGVLVLILTLSPIIFGVSDDAAWSLPWKAAWLAPSAYYRLLVALVVLGSLGSFLSLLGLERDSYWIFAVAGKFWLFLYTFPLAIVALRFRSSHTQHNVLT